MDTYQVIVVAHFVRDAWRPNSRFTLVKAQVCVFRHEVMV